jgi:hypothetical protein
MAGGNAVCGSSAIASIAPVIDADEDDKGTVITLGQLDGDRADANAARTWGWPCLAAVSSSKGR